MSLIWRAIAGEPADVFNDLAQLDEELARVVEYVQNPNADLADFKWSFQDSGGTMHEVVPGGSEIAVQDADRQKFIDALVVLRLQESSLGTTALLDGLLSILPSAPLHLFSAAELEAFFTGNDGDWDVKELQAITEIDDESGVTNEQLEIFWNVIESFDPTQKQRFLKFAYGFDRLPTGGAKFKLQKMVASESVNADSLLPKSHTCFFSLALPEYSSAEICREKLLYAITTCSSIDADFLVR